MLLAILLVAAGGCALPRMATTGFIERENDADRQAPPRAASSQTSGTVQQAAFQEIPADSSSRKANGLSRVVAHSTDSSVTSPLEEPSANIDLRGSGPEQITQEQTPLSVDDCVQLAVSSHPRVLAAQARVAAARSRIPQERALEDPMLDNQFWPIPGNAMQLVDGRMQNQLALSQRVPWPEKLQAKAAIACREMQMAQAEVQTIQLEIAESVRIAYYELWFAERAAAIIQENEQLVADLIRTSESRYRTGGSQQDVLNAEIERERLQQQLFEYRGQSEAAKAELAALLRQPQTLNIKSDEALSMDKLPARLDELIATAERCNPALRGLAFAIQRDIQRQRLADLQRYPDFQLGTQYGFMTRDQALSPQADGVDMISFSAGVTLPIWRDKIRGGISEAYAERANSSQLYQSEQLTIAGQLRRLLAEITALDQQRTLFNERIIPRAQQALQIASSEYTVGKSSFVQLTRNYQELLMYRLQIARFDSAIASNEARLARIVACPQLLNEQVILKQ